MDQVSTDDVYELLNKLTTDFRSTMPMKQKHFQVGAFQVHVQRMVPAPTNEYIDSFIESILSTDYSSKRLTLELANKFKRPMIILEFLRSKEKLLVERALQCTWMYKHEDSPLLKPRTLIRILLPSFSYSTRLKVLSGISRHLKDEVLCDAIFTMINETYGSLHALKLLPSCTNKLIKNFMRGNDYLRIRLTEKQSLKLAKKDFDLTLSFLTFILEYLNSPAYDPVDNSRTLPLKNKHTISENNLRNRFKKILKIACPYFCITYPYEFIQLYQKYSNLIPLERKPKTTKVLLTSCKNEILSNVKLYQPILSHKKIYRLLKWGDLIDFLKSLLPNQLESFLLEGETLFQWLHAIPYRKRWDALTEAFLKKYGKTIESLPEYISPTIMKLIPDTKRTKIAVEKLEIDYQGRITFTDRKHIPKHPEGFWYSFMTLDKSIPKIKEFLNNESDAKVRGELLTYLVQTCNINGNNKKEMLEICKFVLSKSRKDAHLVRHGFLIALGKEFNLQNWMEEDIWSVLMEFIKLAEMYNDPKPQIVIQAAIRYHLLNDRPVETLLSKFVKNQVFTCYGLGTWNWFNDAPDLEEKFLKHCLVQMVTIYPVGTTISNPLIDSTFPYALFTLLNSIADWKKRNRKISSRFTLQNSPWLVARIAEIVNTTFTVRGNIHLKTFEVLRSHPSIMESCREIFIKHCPSSPVLEYYLDNYPDSIKTNLKDDIIPFILALKELSLKSYKQFFKKLILFTEMASFVVEICLEFAQDDINVQTERLNALVMLSYLWDSTNYLNTIALFYPSNPDVVFPDDEQDFESKFQVKKVIVKSLTNTSNPADCLGPVAKFCISDYTKIVTGTLYSTCLHSPQQIAVTFIHQHLLCSSRPVSIRKLAIQFLCTIIDLEEVEKLLIDMWSNETRPTIREVIISELLTFTMQNPATTEKAYKLLTTSIFALTPQDKGGLQELFLPHRFEGLPTLNILDYLKTCHKAVINNLGLLSRNTDFRMHLLPYLIQKIARSIDLFPDDEFLTVLLMDHLFEFEQNEQITQAITPLAVSYLLSNQEKAGSPLRKYSPKTLSKHSVHQKMKLMTNRLDRVKSQWNITKTIVLDVTMNAGITFEKPVNTFVAREAFRGFVTRICKTALELVKKYPENKAMYHDICSNLIRCIKKKFVGWTTFTEILYLNIVLIFIENVTEIGSDPAKVQKSLFDSGFDIQSLTNQIIDEYHSTIFSLYLNKLTTFFQEIYMKDFFNHDIIYLLFGIVSTQGQTEPSIENQVLACNLLPIHPPSIPDLKELYQQLLGVICSFPNVTVKAYLNEKNRQ